MENITKNKPFWALFGTQFLGAFNDNFFRAALITLITYHLTIYSETEKSLFISAAFGLFMLPFFLFSPLAGQCADAFDKAKLIRLVKMAEVVIVGISTYGFMTQNPYFLLGALFFMGTHSAFFGPTKYSVLPDLLSKDTLLQGNGYIEAGTFFAIMLGTLGGSMMIHLKIPMEYIGLQMFGIALLGLVTSFFIPPIPLGSKRLKINFDWLFEMKRLYVYGHYNKRVFKAILGIAWFWLVGTILLAQLPSLAQGVLNVEERVFILLLLLFTLGIGLGSILCNQLLKGEITTKYVPLLSFLLIPFLFDLSSFHGPMGETTLSLATFLMSFQGLRLTFDILSLSFVGGLYIVPLYAFIQAHVFPSRRSQVMALSSILNAGFMVLASVFSFFLLSIGLSIPFLIFLCGIGQIAVTLYIFTILPDPVLKGVLNALLRLLFRLEVKGLEHYENAGKRVVLIANHTSYIDALLVAAALPEKPSFAINSFMAERWWVKPFLVLAKVFPVDPKSPYALREVIEEARQDRKVLIFPEGRLTLTGSLMKIYEGPGMVAEKAEATILPMRIEGAQYSYFSILKDQFPRRLFPKITLTILPPIKLDIDPKVMGKARRHQLSEQLYNIMSDMMFVTASHNKTLFASLLEARHHYGSSWKVLEDASRVTLSYGQLLSKVFVLSRLMKRRMRGANPVGLMLPNTHGTIVSFWAFLALGRTPALLNFMAGPQALLNACQVAELTHILTSRQFVEKFRLQETIDFLKTHKIRIHYLEDEAKHITLPDKLWGIYGRFFPAHAYAKNVPLPHPEDPAVILFTSGSEGVPKGVVLSHENIHANCNQLRAVVDFNSKDLILNVLPLFHAFGLTAGMILPLLSGIKAFHYLSPLHYRVVSELIYQTGATIIFGTDTFLAGYARVSHPYDFYSLRYVFAGAEKLKEETQRLWFLKFGIRLFEGYGATETSPVICVNTMMHCKPGTVGRFLPGISYRLQPVEELTEGGRLIVKGPNVMKGYLLISSPGTIVPPPDGWYDTGDIVEVGAEGYVTIKGRATRFAKVGGEMIPLTGVEDALSRLWPEHMHAVIARADPRKGEQLVLYTTFPKAARSAIVAFWKDEKLPELSIPRTVHILPSMPLLGSGKIDYKTLTGMEA
jgi:acyl-[acyl-carrier-protein]-phospholipid O-acyltransferase/long-chain-fatty-acid--[acyl-carrier-protein] ligase